MIRIVVADDEEVRDIVAKFIDTASEGSYKVVGRAANGKDALELVRCTWPDILVTDICMPGMNGLELIRELNMLDFKVQTLIISGYDDFSYAKTAIGLGVTDYLLKPFSPDELLAALDKMKEMIDQKNRVERDLVQLENELVNKFNDQRAKFLNDLLEGTSKSETTLQRGRELGIDLDADYYCVCYLDCFVEKEGDFTLTQEIGQWLDQVSPHYFDSKTDLYFKIEKNQKIVLLFTGTHWDEAAFQRSISEGLDQLTASVKEHFNLQMRCYGGGICYDWRMIPYSGKEAHAVWRGILDHKRNVYFYSDYEKFEGQNRGFNRPVEMERTLMLQVQMNRRSEALETTDKMIRYYEAWPLEMQDFVGLSLVELILAVARSLKEAGSGYNPWEDKELAKNLSTHFQQITLAKANAAIQRFISKSCDEFCRFNKSQGDKIVAAVKKIVEENISNEDFNLELISSELYFSTPYIRQVFKHKEGEALSEYLIRRRMETACRLLKQPDVRIIDIAEKTGYNNQRYFATAFKKYYGCTPSEYRNRELK